jgi:hypothetical protein
MTSPGDTSVGSPVDTSVGRLVELADRVVAMAEGGEELET